MGTKWILKEVAALRRASPWEQIPALHQMFLKCSSWQAPWHAILVAWKLVNTALIKKVVPFPLVRCCHPCCSACQVRRETWCNSVSLWEQVSHLASCWGTCIPWTSQHSTVVQLPQGGMGLCTLYSHPEWLRSDFAVQARDLQRTKSVTAGPNPAFLAAVTLSYMIDLYDRQIIKGK